MCSQLYQYKKKSINIYSILEKIEIIEIEKIKIESACIVHVDYEVRDISMINTCIQKFKKCLLQYNSLKWP